MPQRKSGRKSGLLRDALIRFLWQSKIAMKFFKIFQKFTLLEFDVDFGT